MKRILIFMVAVLLPIMANAQAQINTKKMKIADFTQKTTKVVLTGNEFYDAALRSEIAAAWTLSHSEFCTLEEFEVLKFDDSYYFLITADGQFKNEETPGIVYLTLIKGGRGASYGINKMLEIISLPIASVDDPSGREYIFLPAFIDIIQDYTEAAMSRDINGYIGLTSNTENFKDSPNLEILFAERDLAPDVDRAFIDLNFDSDMVVVSEVAADKAIMDGKSETLVSIAISPKVISKESYCYKMLIHPETHKLYYFRKHRISSKYGCGFLQEDIIRINKQRGR